VTVEGGPLVPSVHNIRVGKVCAFVEQFFPQGMGQSVAEAVAEI